MATGMVRSRSKRSLAREGVRTPVRDDVVVGLPIAWSARVPEPQVREREQSNEGRWSTDRKRSARTSHNLGAQASQMPVQCDTYRMPPRARRSRCSTPPKPDVEGQPLLWAEQGQTSRRSVAGSLAKSSVAVFAVAACWVYDQASASWRVPRRC